MHLAKAFPIFATIASIALADIDLDREDIPTQCTSVCEPLRNLVSQCDVDDDVVGGDQNEDLLERQCVCTNTSFDVAGVAGLCASCMEQNVTDREDLEDIHEIMAACSFQSTSYAPSATTIIEGVTVTASRPTGINQLTTTTGSQPTSASNTNDDNNDDNNGDRNNAAGALAPGMLVSVAGAVVGFAMILY